MEDHFGLHHVIVTFLYLMCYLLIGNQSSDSMMLKNPRFILKLFKMLTKSNQLVVSIIKASKYIPKCSGSALCL